MTINPSSEQSTRPSLFIGARENNFFQRITSELVETVVMQQLRYFAIEDSLTQSDDLYGESTKKSFRKPVSLYCLVLYESPVVQTGSFSTETTYSLKVYVQRNRIRDDLKTQPRNGDFVEFKQRYFEITKVWTPELVAGLDNEGFEMGSYLDCISSRSDVFSPQNTNGIYDDTIAADSINP